MDFIPPMITMAVMTAIIPPLSHGETWQVSLSIDATEFACTILPIPNAATEVNTAKIIPSHFAFIPRSSTYIGPPAIEPSFAVMRYFTESTASANFVAMPKTPVSHIHSTAPGPPAARCRAACRTAS